MKGRCLLEHARDRLDIAAFDGQGKSLARGVLLGVGNTALAAFAVGGADSTLVAEDVAAKPRLASALAARALDEYKRVASSIHEDAGEWPLGTRPATEKDAHRQAEVATDKSNYLDCCDGVACPATVEEGPSPPSDEDADNPYLQWVFAASGRIADRTFVDHGMREKVFYI